MQLSEIRINLCGPAPSQIQAHTQPRIAQSAAAPISGNGATEQGRTDNGRNDNGRNDNGRNDNGRGGRLRAFCSLTFDSTFVVRDVKLIEGNDGLFLAMPSRKLCDRCRRCSEKNHLRARFCNQCGTRLDENRNMPRAKGDFGGMGGNFNGNGRGMMRPKLHADIAHPINAACRLELERRVLMAYLDELERSKQPGYVAPNLDGDYSDFDDAEHGQPQQAASTVQLRRTGTE